MRPLLQICCNYFWSTEVLGPSSPNTSSEVTTDFVCAEKQLKGPFALDDNDAYFCRQERVLHPFTTTN